MKSGLKKSRPLLRVNKSAKLNLILVRSIANAIFPQSIQIAILGFNIESFSSIFKGKVNISYQGFSYHANIGEGASSNFIDTRCSHISKFINNLALFPVKCPYNAFYMVLATAFQLVFHFTFPVVSSFHDKNSSHNIFSTFS